MNAQHMQKVKDVKDGKTTGNVSVGGVGLGKARITTGMKQDPYFVANMSRFIGEEPKEKDNMYQNYRAFYGGATPAMNRASYMGNAAQAQ